jgi:hypothetical protein
VELSIALGYLVLHWDKADEELIVDKTTLRVLATMGKSCGSSRSRCSIDFLDSDPVSKRTAEYKVTAAMGEAAAKVIPDLKGIMVAHFLPSLGDDDLLRKPYNDKLDLEVCLAVLSAVIG